jgi:hypothetical protein
VRLARKSNKAHAERGLKEGKGAGLVRGRTGG